MAELFIAVVVVLVLMNGFMIFVLRAIAQRTERQIESNIVNQLSVYDQLVADQSNELSLLRAQEDAIRARIAELSATQQAPAIPKGQDKPAAPTPAFDKTPRYLDGSFADYYARVRRGFHINKTAALLGVLDRVRPDADQSDICNAVLKKLSLDERFRLLGLDKQAQRTQIAGLLSDAERKTLTDFESQHGDFNFDEYLAYVKDLAQETSPVIRIITGDVNDDFSMFGDRFITEYDPNIIDGMVIKCGNRLYDFSIQKREICS